MTTIQEVMEANRARQERARELNIRAGDDVFPVLSFEEMLSWVSERLGGARNTREINHPEGLRLPALDQEAIDRVMNENPDTIEVLGVEHAVVYQSGRHPRVQLDSELVTAHRWIELADQGYALPGGREIEIVVSFGYYDTIADIDVPRLKEKARERLNREQWDRWDRPEIPVPDPEDESSEVPFIVATYGTCMVTGEELKAYGTARYDSWSGRWQPVWTTDLGQAQEACFSSGQKLDELKVKARERQELEEAKAKAEKIRLALMEIDRHEDWSEIPQNLRSAVKEWRYKYLPRTTAELRSYASEIENLIAQVQDAFEQVAQERVAKEQARAEGSRRLLSFLEAHLASCPFCGQGLEWVEQDAERAAEERVLDLPCQCYPEDNLREVLTAIEAGVAGESIEFDNREATVLNRLVVGGAVAVQFAVYYKYGGWNFANPVELDALATAGEVELVQVWQKPTEDEKIHTSEPPTPVAEQTDSSELDLSGLMGKWGK